MGSQPNEASYNKNGPSERKAQWDLGAWGSVTGQVLWSLGRPPRCVIHP